MSRNTILRLIAAAAWASIAFVAYATLTRVEFVYAIYFKLAPLLMSPAMKTYAHFEHVIVFAVVGALFGFAYPRRTIVVCGIIFGAAALLEVLQTLTPDRHGTLIDALEKIAGGVAGVLAAKAILRFSSRGGRAA